MYCKIARRKEIIPKETEDDFATRRNPTKVGKTKVRRVPLTKDTSGSYAMSNREGGSDPLSIFSKARRARKRRLSCAGATRTVELK